MTTDDFNAVVENRLLACREILIVKGGEYARGEDRLHNFKTAAKIQDTSPERALLGMYTKHLVSVLDLIEDVELGKLPTDKHLEEKMTDSINYHLLLESLIVERSVKACLGR